MPEQLSFAGLEAPSLLTESVFVALFPDAGASARLALLAPRLHDKFQLTGRVLAAHRFHISLHYIAPHLPPNVVSRANEVVSDLAMPPFRIALDRVLSVRGDGRTRPVVLSGDDGIAGLVLLQHRLGQAMEQAGLGRWIGPAWVPHLTLLYDAREIQQQAIEPVMWTAHEIVLVHSLLGRTKYVPLARWPLHG